MPSKLYLFKNKMDASMYGSVYRIEIFFTMYKLRFILKIKTQYCFLPLYRYNII